MWFGRIDYGLTLLCLFFLVGKVDGGFHWACSREHWEGPRDLWDSRCLPCKITLLLSIALRRFLSFEITWKEMFLMDLILKICLLCCETWSMYSSDAFVDRVKPCLMCMIHCFFASLPQDSSFFGEFQGPDMLIVLHLCSWFRKEEFFMWPLW